MPNITTSIPQDVWDLAIEKALKWNECLILGIKIKAKEILPPAHGEIYEESEKSKRINLQNTMQDHINNLNDEIIKLREGENA